ncbi:MAG TPA: hypothetical protein VG106_11165 [Vicinamibacterales bacterium]|nr:hypothetical protein [Vicinamibacterales bacterium]
MTIDDLRSALAARGGHANIWLVYVDDIYETSFNGAGTPSPPHAAFWTRGEAYSCAYRVHVESPRHHCSVFRLTAMRSGLRRVRLALRSWRP